MSNNEKNIMIINCYIETKKGDDIFPVYDGGTHLRLNGYAIIPLEKYWELGGVQRQKVTEEEK